MSSAAYISTHIGRRKLAPSKELKLKKEKMKHHIEDFSRIEEIVYKAAGGMSMDEILDLQRRVKKDLGLRTSRVDWRTKTGVILWFCENWKIISQKIDSYTPTIQEINSDACSSPEPVQPAKELKIEVDFPNPDDDQNIFYEEDSFGLDLYDSYWVL